MPERLLKIRTGRQPHETLVVIATGLLGVVGLMLPHEVSGAIADALTPHWASVFWAGIALFAFITLWGIYKRRIDGLLVERAGLTVLTALYGGYVLILLTYRGWDALAGAALPLAFAIANVVRCFQIGNDLSLLKSYLKDNPNDSVR